MQALTHVQETTMRQWALTAKTRPGKRAKWFLQLNRGLSEEQIDMWWDNAMALQRQQQIQVSESHMAQVQCEPPPQAGHGHPIPSAATREMPQAQYFSGPIPQSQMGTVPEDVLKALPSFPRQPSHSSYVSSQRSSLSTLSSMATSMTSSSGGGSSIFSMPSQDWEIVNHSNRSSGVSYHSSYLPAVDTSSTFSFHDLFSETSFNPNLPSQNGPFVNPAELSGISQNLAFDIPSTNVTLGDCNSSANSLSRVSSASGSASPWPTQYQDSSTQRVTSSVPTRNDPPPKTEKAPVKFACTVCQRPFASKGDWKRHEGSQCEPQKSWVCMMGDTPAISTDAGWLCTFCDLSYPGPHPGDMLTHLEKEHKINQCMRKAPEDRTFKRKDKLKTHLQRVHALSEYSSHWEKWHQCATPHDKAAWGCGFCGGCLFTWEGRLDHIAEHFENRLDILQWSHSLMIIGLLRQAKPDFNVLEPWRTLVDPEEDRYMEWSKEDASDLKLKLEFRKGTPKELAEEAHRLALTAPSEEDRMSIVDEPMWKDYKHSTT